MLAAPTLAAFSMPFGTTFAANLTPDKETGLGEWTEKMFVDTMRTGYHQGVPSNRKLLPPMPITNAYANISDEDLKAMWAYLKSIKPVRNEVPPALNRMGRTFLALDINLSRSRMVGTQISVLYVLTGTSFYGDDKRGITYGRSNYHRRGLAGQRSRMASSRAWSPSVSSRNASPYLDGCPPHS